MCGTSEGRFALLVSFVNSNHPSPNNIYSVTLFYELIVCFVDSPYHLAPSTSSMAWTQSTPMKSCRTATSKQIKPPSSITVSQSSIEAQLNSQWARPLMFSGATRPRCKERGRDIQFQVRAPSSLVLRPTASSLALSRVAQKLQNTAWAVSIKKKPIL